uniref:PRELI domain containing 1b n=2 Tax=Cyprinus carpio TaxID=7962 RepID=A0A8C2GNE4_CYPCA
MIMYCSVIIIVTRARTLTRARARTEGGNAADVGDVHAELRDYYRLCQWGSAGLVMMGKYFFSETDIKSTWDQVLAAFWQRYPNPYSTHVLTEDVLFREVTPDNLLLSRRLLTKTSRLPRWAERVFPGNLSRSVYIIEDSVVDLGNRSLTTLTWNVNHAKLMRVVERCVFAGEQDRPVWTRITREAWISSGVFGLSRPIQEFGLARFRSNQVKAMKGLEHALSNLQKASAVCPGDSAEKQKNLNSASKTQKPQQYI